MLHKNYKKIVNGLSAKERKFAELLFNENTHIIEVVEHEHIREVITELVKLKYEKRKLIEFRAYKALLVVDKNIPFMLDSLIHFIYSRDAKVISIMRVVVENEIVVAFFIMEDGKRVSGDLEGISNVIKNVKAAVRDWRQMEEFLIGIDNLNSDIETFLKWLKNHFIFLGGFVVAQNKITDNMGVCTTDFYNLKGMGKLLKLKEVLSITKYEKSIVHVPYHMDLISVKHRVNGKERVSNIIGIFSNSIYRESVLNVPIIGEKVKAASKLYGYPEYTYNAKEFLTCLEALPRSELLQMSCEEMLETASQIIPILTVPSLRFFVRKSSFSNSATVTMFLPKLNFSTYIRHSIEKLLLKHFNRSGEKVFHDRTTIDMDVDYLVRLHLVYRTTDLLKYNKKELYNEIKLIITDWDSELSILMKQKDLPIAQFTKEYQLKHTVSEGIIDLEFIYRMKSSVGFKVFNVSNKLKIYSIDNPQLLSDIFPKITNLGILCKDATYHRVKLQSGSIVYIYVLNIDGSVRIDKSISINIEGVLTNIWEGRANDDIFNKLVITCSLNKDEVFILSAISGYLKQIKFPYGKEYILLVFLSNPDICVELVKFFIAKFVKKRSEAFLLQYYNKVLKMLAAVEDLNEDRVLKGYLEVINQMVRSNFFSKNSFREGILSFKIASCDLSFIPDPRPFREIYIYSKDFEAVHLRAGLIARGGIRWSSRREDFRTEILSLMKAQVTKNALIIPTGAKGGFVLKDSDDAVKCYKNFLRSMLELTDNIIDNKSIYDSKLVKYDDKDSYLVVAADKGTASFSDYANDIAKEREFWLSDAFASGGSYGYDHKELGITARGAWVCAEQLFKDLGRDINEEEIKVIGIGDMSGDVFGNGMLIPSKIKLIAAFNHLHIFIDPAPDLVKSSKERKRLFNLPASSWGDYDKTILSKGGGIYDRSSKLIKISATAKKLLSVNKNEFTPDELIKVILKAQCDLLWSAGIGTYVKGSQESDIADKFNENCRVDGRDLRCAVVAEGGNLGFTQKGRIEYAAVGGKISADFIDNSGGVDCSDHEVNIKILFSILKDRKSFLKKRNNILRDLKEEVVIQVLEDNRKQALLLSIEEHFATSSVQEHLWLIKYLETRGELDARLEVLPNSEDSIQIERLSRPELSVLLCHSKNSVYNMIIQEKCLERDIFLPYLLNYFPERLKKEFKEEILSHKLAKYIMASFLANNFVNFLGIKYFHQLMWDSQYTISDILKAFVVIDQSIDIEHIFNSLSKEINLEKDEKMSCFRKVRHFIGMGMEYLLRSGLPSCTRNKIEVYKSFFQNIEKSCSEKLYNDNKLNTFLVYFKDVGNIFSVIDLAEELKMPFLKILDEVGKVANLLHTGWLQKIAAEYKKEEQIGKIAVKSLLFEISDLHILLTKDFISGKLSLDSVEIKDYISFIEYVKGIEISDPIGICVTAVRKLKGIYTNGN